MGVIPEQVLEPYDPRIREAAAELDLDKLTDPDERQIGMLFARIAAEVLQRVRSDDERMVAGLKSLSDARAAFIVALRHRKNGSG
jgi:hypothetical protein